jgi:regulatory protein
MTGSGTVDRRQRQQEQRERRSAVTDPDIVMAAAAALLATRSRTAHELRARLVRLGYPTGLVDQTLDRLLALGYLDDEAYARAWIAGRDRSRPRGASALRGEMLRKGLPRDLVDAALSVRDDGTDRPRQEEASPDGRHIAASADEAAARRLLGRRRAALGRAGDPRKIRQRAYALLARNGFDPGVCAEVARSFVPEAVDVDTDDGWDQDEPLG